jgi:hypothetical protein
LTEVTGMGIHIHTDMFRSLISSPFNILCLTTILIHQGRALLRSVARGPGEGGGLGYIRCWLVVFAAA